MKKFGAIFILFAILTAIFFTQKKAFIEAFNNTAYGSICDTPLHYKVGVIDARFNITKDELISDLKSATDIWDEAEGKNLFTYDPSAKLSVNLVYDRRQALNTEINNLQNDVENKKNQLNPKLDQYERDVADFKNKLADLNNQISSWNSRGGAPPDVYKQLVQQQQNLKQEADSLNQRARDLNQSTNDFNSEVGQLNQTIGTFNQTLKTKPEEGLYEGGKNLIYIYFLTDRKELIHTLAHELGHALGLDHVSGEGSIMYPSTSKSISPTSEDVAAINKLCGKEFIGKIFVQRMRDFIRDQNHN